MPGEVDLTRQVKDALKHLWDLSRLQVHPLLGMVAVHRLPYETAGETLHRQLREAVDMLRPPTFLQSHRKEWVSYRLLCLLYVETMRRRDVQREMCLSERTFYRRHREAIEAVASILWEQRHTSGVPSGHYAAPQETTATGDEFEHTGGLRQARALSAQVPSLQDALSSVLDTIRPVFVEKACSLLADVSYELSETGDVADVLYQLVADALLDAWEADGPNALNMHVTCGECSSPKRGSGSRDAVLSSEMRVMSMIVGTGAD